MGPRRNHDKTIVTKPHANLNNLRTKSDNMCFVRQNVFCERKKHLLYPKPRPEAVGQACSPDDPVGPIGAADELDPSLRADVAELARTAARRAGRELHPRTAPTERGEMCSLFF